ncbi:MAG: Rieske 2Fe-2S domain-containing protein, partial [Acidimicrobiales bacterium]
MTTTDDKSTETHAPPGDRSTTESVGAAGNWSIGSMRMRQVADRAVAVVRTESGFHAVDNACPHQGYGLATGSLDGERLTCQWHNWKFDVRTGRCLMGEEDVACHRVDVVDGEVLVTVNRPTIDEQRARLWPSLQRGIESDYTGQIARDSARLLATGTTPAEIMGAGLAMTAAKTDDGLGHELAMA